MVQEVVFVFGCGWWCEVLFDVEGVGQGFQYVVDGCVFLGVVGEVDVVQLWGFVQCVVVVEDGFEVVVQQVFQVVELLWEGEDDGLF